MNKKFYNSILLICVMTLFVFAGNAQAKEQFNLKSLKKALYRSFGLSTQSTDVTEEITESYKKRVENMSGTVDKAKELQSTMEERYKQMDKQIYGEDSSQ